MTLTAVALFLLLTAQPLVAEPARFRVLVTNDDGVGAAGLAALVSELAANPRLELTVVAPATDRTGSGDQTSGGALVVGSLMTAGGFPALAVSGFPADCVLFGLLQVLSPPPDLVVSGINIGQNIADLVTISGTVGAARTAARRGVPAIAVSQGLGSPLSYDDAARYVARLVERLRRSSSFRRKLSPRGAGSSLLLNVNFPTCAVGSRRGVKVVPLGRAVRISRYTLTADDGITRTYEPVVETQDLFASDCTSTLGDPRSDLEAMRNGFAAVTPLHPDLSADVELRGFRFLQ